MNKFTKKTTNSFKKPVLISSFALFSSALAFLTTSTNSFADTASFNSTNSVTVAESVSISTSASTVSMQFDPASSASAATLHTSSVVVNVSTNVSTGYQLSMTSSTASNTALTSAYGTIPTLSAATTVANFPANQWGYSIDYQSSANTGNFYAVQPLGTSTGTSLKTTSAAAETSQTVVTFGTKVTADKPAGKYASTVTFTAVAPYTSDDDSSDDSDSNDSDQTTPTVATASTTPSLTSTTASSPSTTTTSSTSNSTATTNTDDSYTSSLGVRELNLSDDSEGDGIPIAAVVASAAVVTGATAGIVFLLLKRRDEEEDDEDIIDNTPTSTPDSPYSY